jgi:hypothetical protein
VNRRLSVHGGAHLSLVTAGVRVELRDLTGRQLEPVARAAGFAGTGSLALRGDADVRVTVDRGHHGFVVDGLRPVTRGVSAGGGRVVLRSVGGSGFDQVWDVNGDVVEVRSRWVPGALERGASALRGRHHALRAQVLLHHPALWWAGTRGLAPLHVSVLELDGVVVMLAGPGGVGKSTLVAQAVEEGARATCDNLAVSDGTTAYGLREAMRLSAADTGSTAGGPPHGRATTHGRRELTWATQVPSLRPDLVVVLRRGDGPRVRPVDGDVARRALVAGTFAAGELRRFWTLTAVLGLATGHGPVLPVVDETARQLCTGLPCVELELGERPGASLREMLAPQLEQVLSTGVVR